MDESVKNALETDIELYNEFLQNETQDIVQEEVIGVEYSAKGIDYLIVITFGQLYLTPPIKPYTEWCGVEAMCPSQCISEGLTYAAHMECDIESTVYDLADAMDDTTSIWKEDCNVTIMKMPVMVGSVICTINTTENKEQSEEQLDSGGYFIINGTQIFYNPLYLRDVFKKLWHLQIPNIKKKLKAYAHQFDTYPLDIRLFVDADQLSKALEDNMSGIQQTQLFLDNALILHDDVDTFDEIQCDDTNTNMDLCDDTNTNMDVYDDNDSNVGGQKSINYLELDDYMISLDDVSLNKLTSAQLMQRLRSHNLPYHGLKHELIERWRNYKSKQDNNCQI